MTDHSEPTVRMPKIYQVKAIIALPHCLHFSYEAIISLSTLLTATTSAPTSAPTSASVGTSLCLLVTACPFITLLPSLVAAVKLLGLLLLGLLQLILV